MSKLFVNDSGTVRELTKLFVNDGGTVRELTKVFALDGSTVRQIFGGLKRWFLRGTAADSEAARKQIVEFGTNNFVYDFYVGVNSDGSYSGGITSNDDTPIPSTATVWSDMVGVNVNSFLGASVTKTIWQGPKDYATMTTNSSGVVTAITESMGTPTPYINDTAVASTYNGGFLIPEDRDFSAETTKPSEADWTSDARALNLTHTALSVDETITLAYPGDNEDVDVSARDDIKSTINSTSAITNKFDFVEDIDLTGEDGSYFITFNWTTFNPFRIQKRRDFNTGMVGGAFRLRGNYINQLGASLRPEFGGFFSCYPDTESHFVLISDAEDFTDVIANGIVSNVNDSDLTSAVTITKESADTIKITRPGKALDLLFNSGSMFVDIVLNSLADGTGSACTVEITIKGDDNETVLAQGTINPSVANNDFDSRTSFITSDDDDSIDGRSGRFPTKSARYQSKNDSDVGAFGLTVSTDPESTMHATNNESQDGHVGLTGTTVTFTNPSESIELPAFQSGDDVGTTLAALNSGFVYDATDTDLDTEFELSTHYDGNLTPVPNDNWVLAFSPNLIGNVDYSTWDDWDGHAILLGLDLTADSEEREVLNDLTQITVTTGDATATFGGDGFASTLSSAAYFDITSVISSSGTPATSGALSFTLPDFEQYDGVLTTPANTTISITNAATVELKEESNGN